MAQKVSGTQLRRIIREEKRAIQQELMLEKMSAMEKLKKGYDFAKKGFAIGREITQSEEGRKAAKRGVDTVEKKLQDKGVDAEYTGLGRHVAGKYAGIGGMKDVSDVEISNRDIMILARRAKHSKKKFKTPTGMPIIGVKIEKSEETKKPVYTFQGPQKDEEIYVDRGDGIYEFFLESRIRKIVREALRSRMRLK